MTDKETVSVSADTEFLAELSDYLEILSNPARIRILKVIEKEPKEIGEIASKIDTSYANTKKHIDQLVNIGLVKKEAGFGRETAKGFHPVWMFSLVEGGLDMVIRNIGVFSSINVPIGPAALQAKIEPVRRSILHETGGNKPALHLVKGGTTGRTFLLTKDWILIGRIDPDFPSQAKEGDICLPEEFAAVTRITRPHGIITRSGTEWYLEDRGSSGGTYINAERITPMERVRLNDGDIIDLSMGDLSARFLFVANE